MAESLGKVRLPAIAVVLVLAIVLFVRLQTSRQPVASADVLLPPEHMLAVTLHRAGLGPEALAATGLSASAVSAVVANVHEYLLAGGGPLVEADQAFATARAECAALKRVIQSGQASQEQVAAYPAAVAIREQSRTQREFLLNAAFEAGTASLAESQRATLTSIRDTRRWRLPTALLVVDRSEAEWVELRNCLANERIAAELLEPPDPANQAVLAEARSQPLVSVAQVNLDTHLQWVTASWDEAVEQADAVNIP